MTVLNFFSAELKIAQLLPNLLHISVHIIRRLVIEGWSVERTCLCMLLLFILILLHLFVHMLSSQEATSVRLDLNYFLLASIFS